MSDTMDRITAEVQFQARPTNEFYRELNDDVNEKKRLNGFEIGYGLDESVQYNVRTNTIEEYGGYEDYDELDVVW